MGGIPQVELKFPPKISVQSVDDEESILEITRGTLRNFRLHSFDCSDVTEAIYAVEGRDRRGADRHGYTLHGRAGDDSRAPKSEPQGSYHRRQRPRRLAPGPRAQLFTYPLLSTFTLSNVAADRDVLVRFVNSIAIPDDCRCVHMIVGLEIGLQAPRVEGVKEAMHRFALGNVESGAIFVVEVVREI